MTVSSQSSRIVCLGNGSATVFAFPFKILAATDLSAIYTDATGNSTTLSPGQYTVASNIAAFPTDDTGGTVTYNPAAGPIATGTTLTLQRVMASTQPSSISNQGAFWAATVEAALDRLTLIVQGFIDGMSRALRIDVTDGSTLNVLPKASVRANGYLGFDGTGQPTVLAAPAGSTPISTAMAPVVNQSTTALARAAMGAAGPADNNAFVGSNTHAGSETFTGTVDVSTGGGRLLTKTRTAGDNGTDAASTAFVKTKAEAVVGGAALRSYLAGLGTANNAGTPNTKIDVAAGVAADDTNALMLAPGATTLDCTTVGANGLDAGSLANSTWYHLFVIGKADGSAFALLASTSLSSPTFPAGYTLKRRISSFKTDGSAHILTYIQDGDYFRWKASVLDVNDANPGTSTVTKTLASVPTGINVQAILNSFPIFGTSTGALLVWSDLAANDEAPSASAAPLNNGAADTLAGGYATASGQIMIRTNTSAQVRYRLSASGASDIVKAATLAWYDRRGRDA